jgi:hypothetical protein
MDGLIKITIGLEEPMREGDAIRCLLIGQRSWRIHILTQRVQGGFRVIPMRIMVQRYSQLDETHLVKRSIKDIS